jgi:hypothetical protein
MMLDVAGLLVPELADAQRWQQTNQAQIKSTGVHRKE